jgi:hypothetical protein
VAEGAVLAVRGVWALAKSARAPATKPTTRVATKNTKITTTIATKNTKNTKNAKNAKNCGPLLRELRELRALRGCNLVSFAAEFFVAFEAARLSRDREVAFQLF